MTALSSRDKKGYAWEVEVQDLLKGLKVEFTGNPRDPNLWKQHVGKGVDIITPQLDLEIECKFVTVDVWAAGLLKNYIKRFNAVKYKVIVTNDLTKFNGKCRKILQEAGIKLLNREYFLQFMNDLLTQHKGANSITFYPLVLETLFELRESRGQTVEELGSFLEVTFDTENLALCFLFKRKMVVLALPPYMEFYSSARVDLGLTGNKQKGNEGFDNSAVISNNLGEKL